MKSTTLALILAALTAVALAERFPYLNYKLLRLNLQKNNHIELVDSLQHNEDFDLWTKRVHALNDSVSVLLSPEAFQKYVQMFKLVELPFHIVEENFENILAEQHGSMSKRQSSQVVGRFVRHGEISTFIDQVVAANPSLASSYSAGTTYEKRNMKVLVLKTATSRRGVWIDCGIHAREWISPATCVWIIDKLIKDYKSNNPTVVKLLNYYEFHILPVLNPDGYEYTFSSYRMWRKNRRPNSGSTCVGVDLNRNSGYQWMTGGSSSNPCSDTYAGPSANSELEIKALQSALNRKQGFWDVYLTLHTFGQWWFTPWGYTSTLPSDYTELAAKARIGVNAIKAVNGLNFVVDSSTRLLGVGSGGSEDWTKGVAQIKYSYCLELRPSQNDDDGYRYGFALPENRAPLAGEETYQGIRAFLNSLVA